MEKHLHQHRDERGVWTITLNRPEKHNAFDDLLIADLHRAFDEVAEDTASRALVLAAEGKNFCAGADLEWMRKMAGYSQEQNKADSLKLAAMLDRLNTLPVPTIAKIQGAAFGGAVGLVACCDMAIATKLSKFCLSEVKVGLVPATISPYVIQAIGAKQARRYFLTAEAMSARRARRLGLINETVSEEDLETAVESLLVNLLANGPMAIAKAKQLISDVANQPINPNLMDQTSQLIADIRVSDEGQEGLGAFLQKRAPSWRQG